MVGQSIILGVNNCRIQSNIISLDLTVVNIDLRPFRHDKDTTFFYFVVKYFYRIVYDGTGSVIDKSEQTLICLIVLDSNLVGYLDGCSILNIK